MWLILGLIDLLGMWWGMWVFDMKFLLWMVGMYCLIIVWVLVLLKLNELMLVFFGCFGWIVGYGMGFVGMIKWLVYLVICGFNWFRCRFGGMVLCCMFLIILNNFVRFVDFLVWLMIVFIELIRSWGFFVGGIKLVDGLVWSLFEKKVCLMVWVFLGLFVVVLVLWYLKYW